MRRFIHGMLLFLTVWMPPVYAQSGLEFPEIPELPNPVSRSRERLDVGQYLSAGELLESVNHRYQLLVQDDGNCVVYEVAGMKPRWNTITRAVGCRLTVGSRGQLLLVDGGGVVQWHQGQEGPSGTYFLLMQDDGNLVLYRQGGPGQMTPQWASQREGRSGLTGP